MRRELAAAFVWRLPVLWVAREEAPAVIAVTTETVVHVIHSLPAPEEPAAGKVRRVGAGRER